MPSGVKEPEQSKVKILEGKSEMRNEEKHSLKGPRVHLLPHLGNASQFQKDARGSASIAGKLPIVAFD